MSGFFFVRPVLCKVVNSQIYFKGSTSGRSMPYSCCCFYLRSFADKLPYLLVFSIFHEDTSGSAPLLRPVESEWGRSLPCRMDRNYHMGHGAKKQRHVPDGDVP